MNTKNITMIALFAVALTATTGCFRNDRRTGQFDVPRLQTQECLTYLTSRLRAAEGVEQVDADFATGKVMVTFNGLKLALKNIEIIIADAGFDVNERPANEVARASMPAPCR
jgi:copper chaperone CopZ